MKTATNRTWMRNELGEVQEKTEALFEFKRTPEYRVLPEYEKELIERQLEALGDYGHCLEVRSYEDKSRTYGFLRDLAHLLSKYDALIEVNRKNLVVKVGINGAEQCFSSLSAGGLMDTIYE